MPRSLRRLIQRQGEEIRQLTTQVKGQREEIRQLWAYDRRWFIRWLIREAPANLVVTLFGGWLLYWWQRGTHHSVNARAATWGFHFPADGVTVTRRPAAGDGVRV